MANLAEMAGQTARPRSKVYRRLFIKRRSSTTGLFESTWQDVSDDVISWGSIKSSIDSIRRNKFQFGNMSIKMDNSTGKYNDELNENSFWYGYLSQQRSLVKIEAGIIEEVESSTGLWNQTEHPGTAQWDVDYWDSAYWDETGIVFSGFIWGDIGINSKNEAVLRISPLQEVFRQYAAQNLSGYDDSMTAIKFYQNVRDQVDAGANKLFLPFFGDTTTGFSLVTTTSNYIQLNTSTADDVIDKDVWTIMEKLAETENLVTYVTREGILKLASRSANTSTAAFEFFGGTEYDSSYRNNIKSIDFYGRKMGKFYSRVQIRHNSAETSTSFATQESAMTISGASSSWIYGQRSYNIENLWLSTTAAETLATTVFNEVNSVKKHITFSTTFIPHLEIFDKIQISYDPSPFAVGSLWDLNNWADTAGGTEDNDLVWDDSASKNLVLNNKAFDLISIDINLDSFECKFEAVEE